MGIVPRRRSSKALQALVAPVQAPVLAPADRLRALAEEAQRIVDWWKARIGLQDWDLTVRVVAPDEMPTDDGRPARAMLRHDWDWRWGRILLSEAFTEVDFPMTLEDLLLHELHHGRLDQRLSSADMYQSAADIFAKTVGRLREGGMPPWWPRRGKTA